MTPQACSFCRAELLSGFVELRPPWFNPFIGGGPSKLQFVRDATEFDVVVPAQRKLAYFCRMCESAVITDRVWTP